MCIWYSRTNLGRNRACDALCMRDTSVCVCLMSAPCEPMKAARVGERRAEAVLSGSFAAASLMGSLPVNCGCGGGARILYTFAESFFCGTNENVCSYVPARNRTSGFGMIGCSSGVGYVGGEGTR